MKTLRNTHLNIMAHNLFKRFEAQGPSLPSRHAKNVPSTPTLCRAAFKRKGFLRTNILNQQDTTEKKFILLFN